MIRFMNRNNLNPRSTVFQARMRQNLANAFISLTVLSAMPGIMMAMPVGLALGGIRAVLGPKIEKKQTSKVTSSAPEVTSSAPEVAEKNSGIETMSEEDSGISEVVTSSEATSSSSEDEKEVFDYRTISPKQKLLEFSESLGPQIQEYLIRTQKTAILVTLRDVATLLQMTSSDSENTVRIQYKKRKMKMMQIPVEGVQEILDSAKGSEGSPVLVYFFKEHSEDVNVFRISEDRKFVMELKEVIAENGEGPVLENSDSEFLVVKKDTVVWVNAGF